MIYDFHTHSFFSDGDLSPIELIRRAHTQGYAGIAITDHASPSNLELVLTRVREDCLVAERAWGITVLVGVELTHVPAGYIGECVKRARCLGADLVAVHGETVVEPVEPGTNRAAILSGIDILAYPGFITEEEARLAKEHQVFLEISARRGHSLTNGHVAKLALATGALLLVNSDAHAPEDILTEQFAANVALGAGLPHAVLQEVMLDNPLRLLARIRNARRK